MRPSRLALALASTCMMTAALTGCIITDRHIYSVPPAVGPTAPAVSRAPAYDMDGSTIFDAHHAVQRYLDLHYPNAELVRIHARMVGTNSRIAKTSAWEFTYRVKTQSIQPAPSPSVSPTPIPTPSANPSFSAQAVIPTTFQYRLLNFVYTGKGELLAPEEQDDMGDTLVTINFPRAILLSKAIETALDIGMGVGAPGLEVTLRPTVNGGAVYELDSSVATRQVLCMAAPVTGKTAKYASYDSWESDEGHPYGDDAISDERRYRPTPRPAPKTAFLRGKYLLDAYTGAIIERPNKL